METVDSLRLTARNRVLFLMPHPDDETVFTAGFLQYLARHKIRTRIIVATRGEKSTHRFHLSPDTDLAMAREDELRDAIHLSGHRDLIQWTYPDGGLKMSKKSLDVDIMKARKQFKATHLVTLEPDGIYGHPDHIALSQVVTAIGKKLHIPVIYATVRPNFILPQAVHMAEKSSIAPIKPDVRLPLSPREIIVKWRMLYAHRSQFHMGIRGWKNYRQFLRNGMFTSEYFAIRK